MPRKAIIFLGVLVCLQFGGVLFVLGNGIRETIQIVSGGPSKAEVYDYGVRVKAAVEQYHADHGRYPKTLDEVPNLPTARRIATCYTVGEDRQDFSVRFESGPHTWWYFRFVGWYYSPPAYF